MNCCADESKKRFQVRVVKCVSVGKSSNGDPSTLQFLLDRACMDVVPHQERYFLQSDPSVFQQTLYGISDKGNLRKTVGGMNNGHSLRYLSRSGAQLCPQ